VSASGWVFVFSFLVALTLIMAANMRIYSIWDEVNRQLPKESQIDMFGLTSRSHMWEILSLHAEMYPESSKRRQMWVLVLLGFVFLFGGFVASFTLFR
jgi:hypothetical protein